MDTTSTEKQADIFFRTLLRKQYDVPTIADILTRMGHALIVHAERIDAATQSKQELK
jgi:hypothetical protein